MSLRHPPRLRDGRSFILVEVLLSVMILSVSLTLMIRAMTLSLTALHSGLGYTPALVVLENQMGELLRQGFAAVGVQEERDLSRGGFQTRPCYHYSLTTAPWPEAGEDNGRVSQVDVTIAWRSGRRENRIALQTLLPAPSP